MSTMTAVTTKKRKFNTIKALSFILLLSVLFAPIKALAAGEQAEHEKEKYLESKNSEPVSVFLDISDEQKADNAFYSREQELINAAKSKRAKEWEEWQSNRGDYSSDYDFERGFMNHLAATAQTPETLQYINPWNELQQEKRKSLNPIDAETVSGLQSALNKFVLTIIKVATPIAILMFVATLIVSMFQVDERKVAQLRTATKGVVITWVALLLFYPIVNFIMSVINR